jgi:hypothetical protein
MAAAEAVPHVQIPVQWHDCQAGCRRSAGGGGTGPNLVWMKFRLIRASMLRSRRQWTGGNSDSLALPSVQITYTGWKQTAVCGCRSRKATCLVSFSGSSGLTMKSGCRCCGGL